MADIAIDNVFVRGGVGIVGYLKGRLLEGTCMMVAWVALADAERRLPDGA